MKNLALIATFSLSIAALGGTCDISPDDQLRLLQFHAEMVRNLPTTIRPDLKDMFGHAERPIAGAIADCVSIGPMRFITVPDAWPIYFLDTNRVFQRWEGIASHGPSTWRKDVQSWVSDYPDPSRRAMYAELPLSKGDRQMVEAAKMGRLPATQQIRIPMEDELRDLEKLNLDARTKRLLNRLIAQATMSYLAQEQPAALVERLDVGQPNRTSNTVTVKVLVETAPGTSHEITLKVMINPTMAPYVGTVYQVKQ